MKAKELLDGTIGYAYITLAIAVLSLGTIAFTIIIGRMQYLVNEISYQSYDKRVLKDKKINHIYLMLMAVTVYLTVVYLTADIPKYPLMYLSIIIMALFTVIGLVYLLFISMFKDLSLYSMLDNNHRALIEGMENFDKCTVKLKKTQTRYSDLHGKLIVATLGKYLKWRIAKTVTKMEAIKNEYNTITLSATEELTFVVGNACQRNDSQFAKTAMEYVTKLISHRFITIGSNKKQYPHPLNMMGIYEQYDRFIESSLLPIYKITNSGSATNELTRIANNEFANVLLHGETLRYTDGEGYNFTFQIVFAIYKENIKEQLDNKYSGVTFDYSGAMNKLINKFEVSNSKDLFLDISKNNVILADGVFKNIESVNYMHLLEVQSNLLSQSMLLADDYMLEKILDDTFSMFRISIVNLTKITMPLSLQSINSYWLDTLKPSAIFQKLVWIYNTYYSDNIDDIEHQRKMYIIIERFISSFRKNMNLIVASSMADHMIILSFSSFIKQMIDIISIYIKFDVDSFEQLYIEALRLYSQFASMFKAEKKFDFHQVFEDFEEVLAESMVIENLSTFAIDEYIRFTKNIHKKIITNEYSSRCFDNLIWLPLILDDKDLYHKVLEVIDTELDVNKVTVLINDLNREIYSMERQFSSHPFRKFESMKKYNPEKLDKLKAKLTKIKTKKEKLLPSEEKK